MSILAWVLLSNEVIWYDIWSLRWKTACEQQENGQKWPAGVVYRPRDVLTCSDTDQDLLSPILGSWNGEEEHLGTAVLDAKRVLGSCFPELSTSSIFPPRPSEHDPQRSTLFQEITRLPHFYFLSIRFLITHNTSYILPWIIPALHGIPRNDLSAQAWQLQERNSRQNFPTFGVLRIWIIVQKSTMLPSRYLKRLVNLRIW